jgi:hypothetical protein
MKGRFTRGFSPFLASRLITPQSLYEAVAARRPHLSPKDATTFTGHLNIIPNLRSLISSELPRTARVYKVHTLPPSFLPLSSNNFFSSHSILFSSSTLFENMWGFDDSQQAYDQTQDPAHHATLTHEAIAAAAGFEVACSRTSFSPHPGSKMAPANASI